MNDSWIGMPPDRYRSYGDRLGVLYKTDKQPIVPLAPYDSEQAITHSRPASNGQGPMRRTRPILSNATKRRRDQKRFYNDTNTFALLVLTRLTELYC